MPATQRGYELGRNLALERRGADEHIDRLGCLVDELVASKVDFIVTFGYPAAVAARQRRNSRQWRSLSIQSSQDWPGA